MHTAHGIGHAVGSRTSSHVVRMQRTASAAARSNREVFFTFFVAFFFVGASNRMLEAGRVGGVAGNGNVPRLLST